MLLMAPGGHRGQYLQSYGDKIEKWAFHRKSRSSTLKWIDQEEPCTAACKEWRKIFHSLLSTYGRTTGNYFFRMYWLGKRADTHQKWEWLGNKDVVFHCSGTR